MKLPEPHSVWSCSESPNLACPLHTPCYPSKEILEPQRAGHRAAKGAQDSYPVTSYIGHGFGNGISRTSLLALRERDTPLGTECCLYLGDFGQITSPPRSSVSSSGHEGGVLTVVRTNQRQQVKHKVEDWPRVSVRDWHHPHIAGRSGTQSGGLAC